MLLFFIIRKTRKTRQNSFSTASYRARPLALLVVAADRSAFRNRLNALRQAPAGLSEFDVRLQPRRREPLDVSIRVSVMYDTFGRPSALRWAIRDISARKRAEEEVRALNAMLESRVAERTEKLESEFQAVERLVIKAHAAATEAEAEGRLFENLVQEVDAIVWKADAATGRYTFVSRRAEEILGWPADRWLDDPRFWADHLHPADRQWELGQRQRLLAEGRGQESEYRLVAADGHAVWFRERVRILKGDEGRPCELYGLMVNISKRKNLGPVGDVIGPAGAVPPPHRRLAPRIVMPARWRGAHGRLTTVGTELLELDSGAGLFQLGLGLVGVFLRRPSRGPPWGPRRRGPWPP